MEANCTMPNPLFFYILAKSCEFTIGDTQGGAEYKVNDASTEEGCAKNVRLSSYSHKATGATWEPYTKECWAETGNLIVASKTSYRTCHFQGKVI